MRSFIVTVFCLGIRYQFTTLATGSCEAILAAMVENPVLVERPIVCGPGGVRLCRPAELVAETLAR